MKYDVRLANDEDTKSFSFSLERHLQNNRRVQDWQCPRRWCAHGHHVHEVEVVVVAPRSDSSGLEPRDEKMITLRRHFGSSTTTSCRCHRLAFELHRRRVLLALALMTFILMHPTKTTQR